MGGIPGGSIGEPFNRPLTAHFIGGCAIGDSGETGVIDPYQRVYGHPGLHVADGSAITANLGVNPSLTITAQAERAMAFWPNKGEADRRPGARVGVRPDRPGARPRRPPYPTTPRRPCGCRSSASADPAGNRRGPGRNPPAARLVEPADPAARSLPEGRVPVQALSISCMDDQGPATLPPRPGPDGFPGEASGDRDRSGAR